MAYIIMYDQAIDDLRAPHPMNQPTSTYERNAKPKPKLTTKQLELTVKITISYKLKMRKIPFNPNEIRIL